MDDKARNNLLFMKSAFSSEGKYLSVEEVIKWVKKKKQHVNVKLQKTKFSSLKNWNYNEKTGVIQHGSGKFFTIDGIEISTNWGSVSSWQQPIINQPEIGFLGIITKEFDGILHFLMQAKIEPGNRNYVQLSPTLQATKSNYTQVHEGKKPLYLEYFQNAKTEQILLDQLQSEQGARFLKKRNRNIIIKVEEEMPVYDNYTWVTLAQIKKLLQVNNLVNMDTRTVISGIPYGSFDVSVVDFFNFLGHNEKQFTIQKAFLKSALSQQGSLHLIDDVISYITRFKSTYDLEIKKRSLKELDSWVYTDDEIRHKDNKYFKVIAVEIEISNREVTNWSQPMVEPAQEGISAFVCKEINGILHFAVQTKLECGNHDIVEFAPTVQCLTGNYRHSKAGSIPFLEYVLDAPKEKVVLDTFQSEEGGRFYREQNRNMIVFAGNEISIELPPNYIWLTLNQLNVFLKFNNYLNIQSRSLLSAISFI
ncbi:MAG: NDP-hexose 2,3-dehydratase family protein [Ignavibacteriaceae bacterium]|jgi:oxidase EvaA